MRTEFLICIDSTKNIATTQDGFLHLLQSNPEIDIDLSKRQIGFHKQVFSYKLQDNKVGDKNIVFHFTIFCVDVAPFSLDNEVVSQYMKLLTQIVQVVKSQTDSLQVLWNDINYQCSQLAYPKIYEIENLFRKLITKYMLVNVGLDWENVYAPKDVAKVADSEKGQKREGGLLYKLDFVQITNLLFGKKAKKEGLMEHLNKLIVKINDPSNNEELRVIKARDIEDYVPKTLWDRFLGKIISLDEKKLEKEWKELYQLRNKIAHNTIFTPKDLKRVEVLIGDLKPSIEQVIEKLDDIKLTEADKKMSVVYFDDDDVEFVGDFDEDTDEEYEFVGDIEDDIDVEYEFVNDIEDEIEKEEQFFKNNPDL